MKRSVLLVLALVIVAVTMFLVFPSVDPLTFEYTNIFNPDRQLSLSDLSAMDHLAIAKGHLLRGYIAEAFRELGRAAATPGGLLLIVGWIYLTSLVLWVYFSWMIGKRKGRPGLGVVLGLLLGAIGLVVVLLMPQPSGQESA